jgi:nicotinate-nucleotide pyrophosphorylase (carboxylating)
MPPQMPPLPEMILEPLVRAALTEDLGTYGDITTRTVIPAGTRYGARIRAREAGVVSGMQLAAIAFRLIDPALEFRASIAPMARLSAPATRWPRSRARRPRSCRPNGWR